MHMGIRYIKRSGAQGEKQNPRHPISTPSIPPHNQTRTCEKGISNAHGHAIGHVHQARLANVLVLGHRRFDHALFPPPSGPRSPPKRLKRPPRQVAQLVARRAFDHAHIRVRPQARLTYKRKVNANFHACCLYRAVFSRAEQWQTSD